MAISVFALLESIILARALFVAADLDIAEHLALKPMTVDEIALITNVQPSPLGRLLHFLELNEVFVCNNGYYNLTDFAQTMRAGHPQTIRPFLLHDDETRWNSFGHLVYSIKTGQASFDMLYGQNYFDYTKKDSLLSSRFNDAMAIISDQEDILIAKILTFKNVVADIGGGKGQLLNEIIKAHQVKKAILFDLPETISQVDKLNETCITQGGSFFEPINIKADIYIMKRILHDWDDAQALQILKNISQAMTINSKLYIIDGVLDCSQDKKLLAAIDLALLTIFQGRERTKAEFELLTNQANLQIVNIKTINNLICAIECQVKQ